jgi:acetolactate synthase I/II/III large subunit
VTANEHSAWLNTFHALLAQEEEKVIRKAISPEKPCIHMGEVVNKISAAFDHDAIMVTDVGQHQMMAARYFHFRRAGSIVTSGGLGTMGFGLPAAIGVCLGKSIKTCNPVRRGWWIPDDHSGAGNHSSGKASCKDGPAE